MPDPSDLTTPELAGALLLLAETLPSDQRRRLILAAAARLLRLHLALGGREAPASPGLRPELRDHLDASWKRNEAAYRHLDAEPGPTAEVLDDDGETD